MRVAQSMICIYDSGVKLNYMLHAAVGQPSSKIKYQFLHNQALVIS